MRLGKFTKTPTETKRYKIDYSHWLDSGEYVSAVAFAIISTNTGAVSFLTDTIGATDTDVTFLVYSGTDGETYEVSVTLTTTAGQVKQDVIYFVIKALEIT